MEDLCPPPRAKCTWLRLFVCKCCYCGGAIKLFEWDLCIVNGQTWNIIEFRLGSVVVYCLCIIHSMLYSTLPQVCVLSVFDLPQVFSVYMCVPAHAHLIYLCMVNYAIGLEQTKSF